MAFDLSRRLWGDARPSRRRPRGGSLSGNGRLRLETLEARLAPAVSTWSGAVNDLWSNNGNWDTPPATGNDLVFPATATNKTSTDDFAAGTAFGAFTVADSGYTIGGNAVSLAGPVDASQPTGASAVNMPVVLGNPLVTVDQAGASLTLGGDVSGSNGLTKQGAGTLVLSAANTYTGTTTVGAGVLQVDGIEGSAAVALGAGSTLSGTGSVGSITSVSGTVQPGDAGPGVLTDAGNLTLDPASTFAVALNGAAAGSGYSQLAAGGTVTLNNAVLQTSLGFTPAANAQFTILNNTGSAAVSGTFAGLPEGSVVTAGGQPFRISYAGGTGNDVVLTALTGSATAVTALPSTSVFGQPVALTATVTGVGSSAKPTGSVQFFSGTTPLGNASLTNGTATLSTASLPVGADAVTAVYQGDSSFNASTSPAITATVSQASTTTALSVSPNPSAVGGTVVLTATVTPVAPGTGAPSGTVQFFDGTTSLGTGTLAGGVATLTTTTLALGSHTLTAQYQGDTNFTGSTSTAVADTVNATTTTTLKASSASVVSGQTVTFTATVASTGSGTPTGSVSFVNGTTTLGTSPLTNGVATFNTFSLPVGSDSITAVYGGGSGFSPSTSSAQTVTVAAASTKTTLAVSPNPSAFGLPVTLTATVAPVSPSTATPTGTVQFLNGTTSLGTAALSNGVATLTTSSLPLGADSLTAQYQGTTTASASTSAAVVARVVQGSTVTTVTSSNNSPVANEAVTLTATVAAATGSGTPTGTVLFLVDGSPVGTGTLSNGKATLVHNGFTLGSETVTAVYQGDTNFTGSTSAPLAIQVGTSTEQLINQIYLDVFDRPAEQSALDYWRTQLVIGRPLKAVIREIVNSREGLDSAVQMTYQTFLGRAATPVEVVAAASRPNSSYATVYAHVLGSNEYYQSRGGGTPAGFVNSVYTDLLGVAAPEATVTRLTGELGRGASRYSVALGLVESPQGRAAVVQSLFQTVLGRSPSAAETRRSSGLLSHPGGRRQLTIDLLSSREFTSKYPSVA